MRLTTWSHARGLLLFVLDPLILYWRIDEGCAGRTPLYSAPREIPACMSSKVFHGRSTLSSTASPHLSSALRHLAMPCNKKCFRPSLGRLYEHGIPYSDVFRREDLLELWDIRVVLPTQNFASWILLNRLLPLRLSILRTAIH